MKSKKKLKKQNPNSNQIPDNLKELEKKPEALKFTKYLLRNI